MESTHRRAWWLDVRLDVVKKAFGLVLELSQELRPLLIHHGVVHLECTLVVILVESPPVLPPKSTILHQNKAPVRLQPGQN